MKHIHITLDLPLMPCLRLLIVWKTKMSVCVLMCVEGVGVNVLVAPSALPPSVLHV